MSEKTNINISALKKLTNTHRTRVGSSLFSFLYYDWSGCVLSSLTTFQSAWRAGCFLHARPVYAMQRFLNSTWLLLLPYNSIPSFVRTSSSLPWLNILISHTSSHQSLDSRIKVNNVSLHRRRRRRTAAAVGVKTSTIRIWKSGCLVLESDPYTVEVGVGSVLLSLSFRFCALLLWIWVSSLRRHWEVTKWYW